MLERALEDYQSLGKENILMYPVGKKAWRKPSRKWDMSRKAAIRRWPTSLRTLKRMELAEHLMNEFLERQIDKVELIYHHFKSMGSQVLRENYLPIDLMQVAQEAAEDVPEDARKFQQ